MAKEENNGKRATVEICGNYNPQKHALTGVWSEVLGPVHSCQNSTNGNGANQCENCDKFRIK